MFVDSLSELFIQQIIKKIYSEVVFDNLFIQFFGHKQKF